MRVPIDRQKRLTLLKWLKQGYIEPMDLPEAYKDSTLFEALLMETGTIDDEHPDNGNATNPRDKTNPVEVAKTGLY